MTEFQQFYSNANTEWNSPKELARKAWNAAVDKASQVPYDFYFEGEPYKGVSPSQALSRKIKNRLKDE
jgi:hypothetical protein